MEGTCQLIGRIFFSSLTSLANVCDQARVCVCVFVLTFLSDPQAVLCHYASSSHYVLIPVGSEIIPVA